MSCDRRIVKFFVVVITAMEIVPPYGTSEGKCIVAIEDSGCFVVDLLATAQKTDPFREIVEEIGPERECVFFTLGSHLFS
jgi:hypothetical protein